MSQKIQYRKTVAGYEATYQMRTIALERFGLDWQASCEDHFSIGETRNEAFGVIAQYITDEIQRKEIF